LENPTRRSLTIAGIGAAAILGIAAAWRFTPLHAWADPKVIGHVFRALRDSPWLVPAILGAYVAASATLFPNTAMNAATILALGTHQGPPLALSGSVFAATVFYLLGRGPARERLQRLKLKKLDQLHVLLRRGGVLGMTTLRLVPIAPYTVVNLLAGAARVHPVSFVAGTFLGLLPGCLLLTAFGHQLRAMLRNPGPHEIAIVALTGVAALAVLWGLQRVITMRASKPDLVAATASPSGGNTTPSAR
jgi:uncharacterized membrane protein YdjX (TVP38/TMEM64 family)